jgi:hypothetical protein
MALAEGMACMVLSVTPANDQGRQLGLKLPPLAPLVKEHLLTLEQFQLALSVVPHVSLRFFIHCPRGVSVHESQAIRAFRVFRGFAPATLNLGS